MGSRQEAKLEKQVKDLLRQGANKTCINCDNKACCTCEGAVAVDMLACMVDGDLRPGFTFDIRVASYLCRVPSMRSCPLMSLHAQRAAEYSKYCLAFCRRGAVLSIVRAVFATFVPTRPLLPLRSRQFGHRVKGVSMSSFKSEEVEALKKGGNEVCACSCSRGFGPQRNFVAGGRGFCPYPHPTRVRCMVPVGFYNAYETDVAGESKRAMPRGVGEARRAEAWKAQ